MAKKTGKAHSEPATLKTKLEKPASQVSQSRSQTASLKSSAGKSKRPQRKATAKLEATGQSKKQPTESQNRLSKKKESAPEKDKSKSKLKQDKRSRKKEEHERGKKKQKRRLAQKADKFICYQKSVQCPEHDVEFFEQAYRDVNHRKPVSLREDFCGTFAVSCEWVTRSKDRTAVAIDLCAETLQWGRDHNLSKLNSDEQSRIRLLEQDARTKNLPAVDVVAAQNFSFWIFQTRHEVITYLRAARENLKPGGIMVLDMMGGGDCYREGHEDKKVIGKGKKKFSYFWKQVSFNPFNNNARFAISFRFRDGSKLENAFEYDWRFWTIPEVREMLVEAGFSSSRVYFENEEDDSIWESRERAPSHSVWLAYIVAVR